MDAYHGGTLWPSQVRVFVYVIPSAPDNDGFIICVDLVLTIGWVDSPNLLCSFLETLTDAANALFDTDLPVPAYGDISDLSSTGQVPPHTYRSLTHIDCYMDDIISAVQGVLEIQHQVFDSIVCAFKCMFTSLPEESKDWVIVKKLLAGEGRWNCVKEILGWIIDMDSGTVTLPERKIQELQYLVAIPKTQWRMGRKYLERLVGNLRSIHLAVPGAVAHLYLLQCVLFQGRLGRVWLLPEFY